MIIVDTVDLVVDIDREGNTVETIVAHAAAEASGVVRLAHRV
jgi:uncharacterized alkaline shock family protein YloU